MFLVVFEICLCRLRWLRGLKRDKLWEVLDRALEALCELVVRSDGKLSYVFEGVALPDLLSLFRNGSLLPQGGNGTRTAGISPDSYQERVFEPALDSPEANGF